jgi:hypothetical protein
MQFVFNVRLNDFMSVHLIIVVVFFHLSVGLLNFVTETQQQQNIIHTTTILSEARWFLASTSGELVFFAGEKIQKQPVIEWMFTM